MGWLMGAKTLSLTMAVLMFALLLWISHTRSSAELASQPGHTTHETKEAN